MNTLFKDGTASLQNATETVNVKNVVQFVSRSTEAAVAANNDLFVDTTMIVGLPSTDASSTIQEINNLFVVARSQMQSSRDTLYDYLSRIYEAQVTKGDSAAFLDSLVQARNAIETALKRSLWTTKSFKKDKDGNVLPDEKRMQATEHLLFISTNGMQIYGSLRSKYKKIVRLALEKSIDPKLFTKWLKDQGGVVKALANVVEREPSADKEAVDINALVQQYTLSALSKPTVELPYNVTKNQFSVVVVYHNPQTKTVHHVGTLSEEKEVNSVIRLLSSSEKKAAVSESSESPKSSSKEAA